MRAAVRQPEVFAAGVAHLGSLAGNLQRLYTLARDEFRLELPELLALKAEIRETAAQVRDAIGKFEDV
jgi:hypothetical protein